MKNVLRISVFILSIISIHSCKEGNPIFNKVIHLNPYLTYGSVIDIDSNIYKTITIGTQTWMAENLKTTRYHNGDLIGTTRRLNISRKSTPKYQWAYGGDEKNVATYGRLYSWYAVTDSRNICPTGWHVSTNNEWTTLANYLGGERVAGDKLKETGTTHWYSPNKGATNESGFTALPAGSRLDKLWDFKIYTQMGQSGHFWTATESVEDKSCAWRRLIYQGQDLHMGWASKKIGWPVRCIKD
jgi:uncharacterized protein (TIGR02145 family)